MLAAYYRTQGPAASVLEVGERPVPTPGLGEVRVRVHASGVNPSDAKSRKGGPNFPMRFPLVVPHSDGGGQIDMVGDGVSPSRIGRRVWIWNGQWQRPFGTAAQFVVVPSSQAVDLPAETTYAEAACLGIPAFTACQAVKLAGVSPGSTVLVNGGAGAVGHYAIQFCKNRGARVLTTISSEEKAAHARAAGADATINYKVDDVARTIKGLTEGEGVDAIVELDLSTNAKLIHQVLRPHGTVAVFGMLEDAVVLNARWMLRTSATVRFIYVYDLTAADRTDAMQTISKLLQEGVLRHAICATLPLGNIAKAHELVESGRALGNVVVEIPQ